MTHEEAQAKAAELAARLEALAARLKAIEEAAGPLKVKVRFGAKQIKAMVREAIYGDSAKGNDSEIGT